MKVGPFLIKERITRDRENGTVLFRNVEGSDLQGDVLNVLKKSEKEGELLLTFASNCKNNEGETFPKEPMF